MAHTGTQFLEDIYSQIYNLGLVTTQDQFSQKICGKSPRWYSVVKSSEREPSVSSLLNIATSLNSIATTERRRNAKKDILEIHKKVLAKLLDKTVYYECQ